MESMVGLKSDVTESAMLRYLIVAIEELLTMLPSWSRAPALGMMLVA